MTSEASAQMSGDTTGPGIGKAPRSGEGYAAAPVASGGRFVALWVPNWPLASLVVDTPPGAMAAVVRAGRVTVATPAAISSGVRIGMTRALVQYYCPELLLMRPDPERESAAFEAVLEVFDRYATDIGIVRPGLAFASAGSAAKWAGSEDDLAQKLTEEIAIETGAEVQVGIGTGLATALLAARAGRIVTPGQTSQFLAGQPLSQLVVDLPTASKHAVEQTLQVLAGLGVYTGAQLLQLGRAAVVTRFGQAGQALLQLMDGDQPALTTVDRPKGAVEVRHELDPPTDQLEYAATAIARVSADLADRMRGRGLYSNSVRILLESSGGQTRERTWTLLDATSSRQIAKRITWQVRGWLDATNISATDDPDPLCAIQLTALSPTEIPQVDPLWGGTRASWKAGQVVEQVQGLLGEESVMTPRWHGGFDPRTRVSLTPWGAATGSVPPRTGDWEGAVGDPPAVVFAKPPAVVLLGRRTGSDLQEPARLWVGKRGLLNGEPRQLILDQDRPELAAGYYPLFGVVQLWVVRGRWWNAKDQLHGPRCFLRVRRPDGPDLLLVQREGDWYVEGVYGTSPV